jgi:ABC-type sugar transport system ATPase subunit
MQATTQATVIYVTHDQVEAVALADRVVVMDLGVIQQIGTPLDLYYRPANLFVAGFIGEPPMNTIPCRLSLAEGFLLIHWQGDGEVALRFPLSGLPSPAIQTLSKWQEKDLVLGVRPQRLAILPPAAPGTPGRVPATLLVHEYLGNEGIAQVSVNHTQFECVTLPDLPYQAGEPVSLGINFADLHLFDAQTTQRIHFEARDDGYTGA